MKLPQKEEKTHRDSSHIFLSKINQNKKELKKEKKRRSTKKRKEKVSFTYYLEKKIFLFCLFVCFLHSHLGENYNLAHTQKRRKKEEKHTQIEIYIF